MRFLLVLAIVVAGSSASAMTTTAIDKSFHLTRGGIHQLVASGYVLYEAKLPSVLETLLDLNTVEAKQGGIFLFQDELVDGSRVISKVFYTDKQTDQLTALFQTNGVFSQESEAVDVETLTLAGDTNTYGTISLVSSYGLKRVSDSRLSASWQESGFDISIGFEQSKDYRVYRGQRTVDNKQGGDTPITVTETITINAYNPYVIYRHTSWNGEGIRDEELSIGSHPFLAINFKVDGKIIERQQSSMTGDNYSRPVLTDITYNFDGQTLSERSEEGGNWSIDLQRVKDSDFWLEFEGNIGFTGASLASMLVHQLRDKGKTNEAEIAEELLGELKKYPTAKPVVNP